MSMESAPFPKICSKQRQQQPVTSGNQTKLHKLNDANEANKRANGPTNEHTCLPTHTYIPTYIQTLSCSQPITQQAHKHTKTPAHKHTNTQAHKPTNTNASTDTQTPRHTEAHTRKHTKAIKHAQPRTTTTTKTIAQMREHVLPCNNACWLCRSFPVEQRRRTLTPRQSDSRPETKSGGRDLREASKTSLTSSGKIWLPNATGIIVRPIHTFYKRQAQSKDSRSWALHAELEGWGSDLTNGFCYAQIGPERSMSFDVSKS